MIRSRLTAILLLFTLSLGLQAGPARRGVFTLTQPDGTSFRARLEGDEHVHLLLSEDGCALVRDEEGYYCYAGFTPDGNAVSSGYPFGLQPVPSRVIQTSRNIPRNTLQERKKLILRRTDPLRRKLLSSTSDAGRKPVTEMHVPVILAQFPDLKFTHTRAEIERLLSADNPRGAGAWLKDQFGDRVRFTFDVYDTVTVSKDITWYAKDTKRGPRLIADVCKAMDEVIDFSAYDLNHDDGEVDAVYVFFAGGDKSQGAGDDRLWSHQYWLKDGAGMETVLDGKLINVYACSAELDVTGAQPALTGIGIFCHEFIHALGAPDLYDTDLEGSGGKAPGLWVSGDVMDGGNNNGDGALPPNLSAIERLLFRDTYGLPDGKRLTTGTFTLEPVGRNGLYYYLETDTEGELFLFECRSAEGWDAGIGAAGLAIYHLDYSTRNAGATDAYREEFPGGMTAAERWTYNEVNCRPDHECADLVEADPAADGIGKVYFPQERNKAFTEDTDPPFRFWSGQGSPLSITGIRFDGEAVTFTVTDRDKPAPPEAFLNRQDVFQDAVILQWEASFPEKNSVCILQWGTGDDDTEEKVITAYQPGLYACTLEGLAPRTAYQVRIFFRTGELEGVATDASFTTKPFYPNTFPFIALGGSDRNEDGSWPRGSQIPLRCHNLRNADGVTWTLNGNPVVPGPDGYYTLNAGGTLRATVTYSDGKKDIIQKKLTVR